MARGGASASSDGAGGGDSAVGGVDTSGKVQAPAAPVLVEDEEEGPSLFGGEPKIP